MPSEIAVPLTCASTGMCVLAILHYYEATYLQSFAQRTVEQPTPNYIYTTRRQIMYLLIVSNVVLKL